MQQAFFAQTEAAPNTHLWAQQLLLHAYTRTSPQHAAPFLTAMGHINWWEGKAAEPSNSSN